MPLNRERWLERCDELRIFVGNQARLPSKYSSDPAERSLWTWLHNQRIALRGGSGTPLDQEQRSLLGGIPGAVSPRRRRTWDESYALVQAHFEQAGQRPQASSRSAEEAVLARWLDVQNQRMLGYPSARQYGPLTDEQASALRALPGFANKQPSLPRRTWEQNCEGLELFVHRHGRTPRASSADGEERRLSFWLSKQRSRYQELAPSAKPLSPERRARLEAVSGFVTKRATGRLNGANS